MKITRIQGKFIDLIKNPTTYNPTSTNNSRKCLKELSKDNTRVHRKFVVNECSLKLKEQDYFPSLFLFSVEKE